MTDAMLIDVDGLELSTPRLVLRPVTMVDLDDFHRIITSPGVQQGTLSFPPDIDLEWARTRLEEGITKMQEGQCAYFHIHLRDGNGCKGVVGNIGLDLNERHRRGHLGYMIEEGHRGRGYATEALIAVLEFGFDELQLHRLCAITWTWNEASAKMLISAGFTHEGCSREHLRKDGEYIDADEWGMLATDPRLWKDSTP